MLQSTCYGRSRVHSVGKKVKPNYKPSFPICANAWIKLNIAQSFESDELIFLFPERNNVQFLTRIHFLNRHLREQASIALKNISANPDRTSAFSALSQLTTGKTHSHDEASWHSDTSGIFSSSEKNGQSNLLRTASNGTLLNRGASPKPQNTVSELTSMLSLVFQSDALWSSGLQRQFLMPNHSAEQRLTRLKQPNNFSKKDKYLSSLRVLTNALVVMANMMLISESMEDESGELSVEVR